MKFFVAFAALVAVAVAVPLHKPSTNEYDEVQAIIAAINSPSTDPATGLLLQQMLHELLGVAASPVFVDAEPPSVGPVIIETPEPVDQSPVVIGPIPEGATPLVQIIINVAGGASGAPGAVADAPAIEGDDVIIADSPAENPDHVQVADLPVSDVIVADLPSVPGAGVEVADLPALPVSPVQIGAPQLPIQAANLPDDLN